MEMYKIHMDYNDDNFINNYDDAHFHRNYNNNIIFINNAEKQLNYN